MAECCAERGFFPIEIDDVLERAGVSRESFDSHFAGKEDCASAAFNKLVSDTLATLSTAGAPGAGPSSLARAVKAVLEMIAAEPAFSYLGLIGFRQCGSERMHDAYESAVRVLALMMERAWLGRGGGRLSYTQTRAAVGGAEALLRRELAAGRAATLPSLLSDFVYAALIPFVGQGEALRQAREAVRWTAEEG
jgi:AcrR family transcriptional regulator